MSAKVLKTEPLVTLPPRAAQPTYLYRLRMLIPYDQPASEARWTKLIKWEYIPLILSHGIELIAPDQPTRIPTGRHGHGNMLNGAHVRRART